MQDLNQSVTNALNAAGRLLITFLDQLDMGTRETIESALNMGSSLGLELVPGDKPAVRVMLIELEGKRHQVATVPVQQLGHRPVH